MTMRGLSRILALLGLALAVYLCIPEGDTSQAAPAAPAPAPRPAMAAGSLAFEVLDNPLRMLGDAQAEGSNFGSESAIGDFDGDGIQDLAVGAPGSAGAAVGDKGQVFVFWGGAHGFASTSYSVLTAPDAQPGDRYGMRLVTLPREALPREGTHDRLLVSATGRASSGVRAGCVFLVDVVLDLQYELTPPHSEQGMVFGAALACGDVDLDGSHEILVSARRGSPAPGLLRAGVVWIYDLEDLGAPAIRLANADHRNHENVGNENFGNQITLAYRDGQVEGLVIGAVGNSDGDELDGGAAYLYRTPITQSSFPARSWTTPMPELDLDGVRRFGMSLSGSRDGNGFVVGSPRHDLPMLDGANAITAGLAIWYPDPLGGTQPEQLLTRADGDVIESGQYFGYMHAFGRLCSSDREDLLLISLAASSSSSARIFAYDTASPGTPPLQLTPPDGSSSHFAQHPECGSLGTEAEDGLETVVLCDPYWDPVPDGQELHVGRVLLLSSVTP